MKTLVSEIAARHVHRRGRNILAGLAVAAVIAVGFIKWGGSSPASSGESTGIKVTALRSGVKLLVDGKVIGTLPQEVKGLTPGEHAIVFDAGERYAAQKSTVTLLPGEVKELEPGPLKVTKGAALFDVKTPGASLALLAADERRALTDYSHPIDVDNTKSWTLEATKAGFKPATLPISFEDKAEKTFVIALTEPSGVDILALPSAGAGANIASDTATESSVKAKGKRAKPERVASARFVQPAVSAGAGNCTLNINTIPSSHVTLDGRNIGSTPRLNVVVAAGSHNVVFATENTRKSTIATCRSGEVKTVAMRMPE